MQQEVADLAQLEAELQSRQYQKFSKTSSSQNYYRTRSSNERNRQRHTQTIRDRIEAIGGDITQQQVDAIVNSTDDSFSGQGGVDAAIHAIAGAQLKEACRKLKGISTGEAKITQGYNLPALFVIHTLGPVWQGGNQGEGEILAKCYRNSLTLAEQYSLRTIAFPAISTGALGFPIELACRIAVREVSRFLMNPNSLEKVLFVCLEPSACQCYVRYDSGSLSLLRLVIPHPTIISDVVGQDLKKAEEGRLLCSYVPFSYGIQTPPNPCPPNNVNVVAQYPYSCLLPSAFFGLMHILSNRTIKAIILFPY
jgi:O-acetyl-ADP-ribose deacetylase (regulator of RNase III)